MDYEKNVKNLYAPQNIRRNDPQNIGILNAIFLFINDIKTMESALRTIATFFKQY